VVDVSDSVLQEYFSEAMAEENIDLVVVLAHIDPQAPPELKQIYKAIRNAQPDLPIVLLSGHRHRKYFEWYDENAFTIESGKYFETLGLVRFRLSDGDFDEFSYKWVDTSRDEFYYLSYTDASSFLTPEGQAVKDQIDYYFNKLQLNETVGCSPRDYSPYAPQGQPDSLYGLYINSVLPEQLFVSMPHTQFFMCNSETLRDNIYKGRVTKNDVYSVMPFGDTFEYYANMPGSDLMALLKKLNSMTIDSIVRNTDRYSRYFPYMSDEEDMPPYETTNTTVSESKTYDLVCAHYDSYVIGKYLNELFPNKYTVKNYPTSLDSSTVLDEWIQHYWPCNGSNTHTDDEILPVTQVPIH